MKISKIMDSLLDGCRGGIRRCIIIVPNSEFKEFIESIPFNMIKGTKKDMINFYKKNGYFNILENFLFFSKDIKEMKIFRN